MDYSSLFEQVTALASKHKALEAFSPVTIHYAPVQTFTTPLEVLKALETLGPVTGWITWPDNVERIEQPNTLLSSELQPPLEGELITSDNRSIRIHYRNQCWQLISITLTPLNDANHANALMDTSILAAREPNKAGLMYQRIWTLDDDHGVIAKDAIFMGFAGEKQ